MSARTLSIVIGLTALTGAATAAAGGAAPDSSAKADHLVEAEAPPFSEGIYPCTQCHDKSGNKTRRTLEFHDDVQTIFDHDAEHRWCLDCHDNDNRDVLHLSSGDAVPFTESYRLCGQCHGDKYRDWRAGVHGKRIGHWDGEKTYFLCVNCHNPHAPRFKGVTDIAVAGKKTTAPTPDLIKPLPRPRRPEEMR